MTDDLRILLVNDQAACFSDDLRKKLSCEVDVKCWAQEVIAYSDPLKYNVAIIDASNDVIVDGHYSLSEYLKNKNPNMIVIGTSVMGRFLSKDPLATQLYDEKISMGFGSNFTEDLKKTLRKYGFEFRWDAWDDKKALARVKTR